MRGSKQSLVFSRCLTWFRAPTPVVFSADEFAACPLPCPEACYPFQRSRPRSNGGFVRCPPSVYSLIGIAGFPFSGRRDETHRFLASPPARPICSSPTHTLAAPPYVSPRETTSLCSCLFLSKVPSVGRASGQVLRPPPRDGPGGRGLLPLPGARRRHHSRHRGPPQPAAALDGGSGGCGGDGGGGKRGRRDGSREVRGRGDWRSRRSQARRAPDLAADGRPERIPGGVFLRGARD